MISRTSSPPRGRGDVGRRVRRGPAGYRRRPSRRQLGYLRRPQGGPAARPGRRARQGRTGPAHDLEGRGRRPATPRSRRSSCDGCHATAISFQVVVADKSPTSLDVGNVAYANNEGARRARPTPSPTSSSWPSTATPASRGPVARAATQIDARRSFRLARSGSSADQIQAAADGYADAGRRHPVLRAAGAPGRPQGRPEAARSRTEVGQPPAGRSRVLTRRRSAPPHSGHVGPAATRADVAGFRAVSGGLRVCVRSRGHGPRCGDRVRSGLRRRARGRPAGSPPSAAAARSPRPRRPAASCSPGSSGRWRPRRTSPPR